MEESTRDLLEQAIPLRLALTLPEGPLVVPLWFEFRAGQFVCAAQAGSRIVRGLRHAPSCAFDVSTNEMPYRGLRGRGTVHCDPDAGPAQLDRLLSRYLGSLDSPLAQRLRRRAGSEVALVITPTWISTWDYTARMRGSLPSR